MISTIFTHPVVKKLWLNTGSLGSATWISAALGLVQVAVLARYFGMELYGNIAIFHSFGTICMILCGLPTWQTYVVLSHRLDAEKRVNEHGALLRLFQAVDLGSALAIGLLITLASFGFGWLGLWPGSLPQQDTAMLACLYCVMFPCMQMAQLPVGYLRSRDKIRLIAIHKLLTTAVVTAALCFGVWVGMDFVTCIWVFAVFRSAELLSLSWFLRRDLAQRGQSIAPWAGLRGYRTLFPDVRRMIRTSYAQTLGFALMEQMDTAIAGVFLGTTEAGYLKIIKSLSSVIQMLSQPFKQLIYPVLSALVAHKERGDLQALLRGSWGMLGLVILVIGVGFALFGEWALTLLGGVPAAPMMIAGGWYVAGALAGLAAVPLMPLYYASGQDVLHQWILWGAVLIALPGMALGGWFYGLTGIGCAYAAFHALYGSAAARILWRKRAEIHRLMEVSDVT